MRFCWLCEGPSCDTLASTVIVSCLLHAQTPFLSPVSFHQARAVVLRPYYHPLQLLSVGWGPQPSRSHCCIAHVERAHSCAHLFETPWSVSLAAATRWGFRGASPPSLPQLSLVLLATSRYCTLLWPDGLLEQSCGCPSVCVCVWGKLSKSQRNRGNHCRGWGCGRAEMCGGVLRLDDQCVSQATHARDLQPHVPLWLS